MDGEGGEPHEEPEGLPDEPVSQETEVDQNEDDGNEGVGSQDDQIEDDESVKNTLHISKV